MGISNLRRQEQRLLEIVSQARTVEDLLKVEEEIGRVRGKIESLTVLIGAAGRAVVALFAALPYLVLLVLAGWAAWRLGRRCSFFRRASGGIRA